MSPTSRKRDTGQVTTPIAAPDTFSIYDTTLIDVARQVDTVSSVAARLRILELLDKCAVSFVAGGRPDLVAEDAEFLRRARERGTLRHATLVPHGMVRPIVGPLADAAGRALLDTDCPTVALTVQADERHVEREMRTSLSEHLSELDAWVRGFVGHGRRVFVDCAHYFDGFIRNEDYALEVVRRAAEAGASVVVLGDTNGGMLPNQVADMVSAAGAVGMEIGVHCANDTGCAVANTLAAVEAGATQVRGSINGYGPRAGSTDLTTLIPNLQLKLGWPIIPDEVLARLTHLSRAIADVTNQPHQPRQPYVGEAAFAQRALPGTPPAPFQAGLFQHTEPKAVGNMPRLLVGESESFGTLSARAEQLGLRLCDAATLERFTEVLGERERRGYSYEATDASFELLLRNTLGTLPEPFTIRGWRVFIDCDDAGTTACEASVRVEVDGVERSVTGYGNGPINALDHAIHEALAPVFAPVSGFSMIDYRVRVLGVGTDGNVRTIIDMTDGVTTWSCVGVGTDVIEASQEALYDAYLFGIIRTEIKD